MKNFTPFFICFCLLLFAEYSEAQVTKISNNTNFQFSITLGSKAILVDDKDSIWVTNGTPAGTKKVTSKVAFKDTVAIYKNKVFFAGKSVKGIELWATDGTDQGTALIKDIYTGATSSSPSSFFVFNNILFFYAKTAANGNELWKSDGTPAGTALVKDIWPGSASSNQTAVLGFYPAGGVLYFQANDGVNGDELWKTNGTTAGTVLVKNLSPGNKSLEINTWHSLNNKLIFVGKDSDLGIKVWQTDGTSAGTTLKKTLLSTSDNAYINAYSLSNFKNKLVFALLGFSSLTFNPINRLYVTDGTDVNTILLKDVQDNNILPLITLTPTLNNKFYFTTYASNGDSAILWESNATTAGTKITKLINTAPTQNLPFILPNFLASNPDSIATSDFNGKFFMVADNGTKGYEPWITDGTTAGTKIIKDIYANQGSSIEEFNYVYSKSGLYFSANDNIKGNELWLSNGTSAGTNIVADIRTGPIGSDPIFMGILNKRLLFTANDGDNAQNRVDLYKVDVVFDTLSLAKTESEDAIIAPDGTKFSIYPNPAKDLLNVNLSKSFNSDKISLVITDQKGKQVYENQVSGMQFSSTYKIDISNLAQGTYYLEVRTDKGVVSKKFIKIR